MLQLGAMCRDLSVRFLVLSICPDHQPISALFQYYMLESHHMISVFAAMLHERRILFVSKSLKKLTSSIFAAESLIYPMYWQVRPRWFCSLRPRCLFPPSSLFVGRSLSSSFKHPGELPLPPQHIFIPVLPESLVDYISAPMPYLIGVPSELYEAKVRVVGAVTPSNFFFVIEVMTFPFPEIR